MMSSDQLTRDIVLLHVNSPLPIATDAWEQVRCELEKRLGGPVILIVGEAGEAWLQQEWDASWEAWQESGISRVLLLRVGDSSSTEARLIDSFLWSFGLQKAGLATGCPRVFLAPAWDASDWAEILLSSQPAGKQFRWQLGVPSPGMIDPIEEDRLSIYRVGERDVRREVTEVIWELRRRGASADYCFLKRPIGNEALEEFEKRPPQCLEEVDAEVSFVWDCKHPLGSESNSESVSSQLKSFAYVKTAEARYRVPLQRVVPLAGVASILVSKLLLASSYGELYATKAATLPPVGEGVVDSQERERSSVARLDMSYARLLHEMSEMLPAQYSGHDHHVNPRSMGSAKLQSDEFGVVPWGEIWTSFCELALAGGPPHRGRLLEPVNPKEIAAAPERYERVVEELKRGIFLASGLHVTETESPGWVGVHCESQEMAGWMVRSMNAENVVARREEYILFVPAGPDFTIKREIKNVITAVTKSNYYWESHRRGLES